MASSMAVDKLSSSRFAAAKMLSSARHSASTSARFTDRAAPLRE
jgi:hypothetical protein